MGGLWGVVTVLGPIVLAGVIVWAIFRNRRHETPAEIAQTEAATDRLYEQIDAEDHARDDKVER